LGTSYIGKIRCYREHVEERNGSLGNMLRNTMGAWETCWELDKNTSRKNKIKKNSTSSHPPHRKK
jgi:hypothetical protein